MAEDIDRIEVRDHTDSQIVNPDSLGAGGAIRVSREDSLRDIAARALAADEPHIVNIDLWRFEEEDPLPDPE